MTTRGTLNESIRIINEYSAKLQAGTLNKEELEDFVEQTRSLNEHAIVLRYKAYENQVFGESIAAAIADEVTPVEPTIEHHSPVIEQELPLFEIPFDISEPVENELNISSETTEETWEEIKQEVPAIEVSPDNDMAAIPENDHIVETPEIATETEEIHSALTEIADPTYTNSPSEPEEEKITIESFTQETVEFESEEHSVSEEEIAVESHNEQVITEAPADIQTSIKFIQKFRETPLDMVVQLRMTKLDKLVGSFGLNERIQFINELFKGSGEDFSNAISELDGLTDIDNALMRTSVFAADFKWDLESSTVNDFVWKLKRRYA